MVKEEQVKVLAFLPRRPDVTPEYFHEHWLHPHGTWTLGMKTLRRYVQSHRVAPGVPGIEASPYEGIAMVWFDDLDAALDMGNDPVYLEKVNPDEPLFIDLAGLGFVMTEEQVLRTGPATAKDAPSGAKAMVLLRRADGVEPEDFAERARAAADGLEDLVPEARRATLAIALPVNYAEGAQPAADAVLELWFDDADAFGTAWEEGGPAVLGKLEGLIDPNATVADLYEDARLIWPAAAVAGAA